MSRPLVLALLAALAGAATAHAAARPPLTPVTDLPSALTESAAAWRTMDGQTHVLADDQPLDAETRFSAPPECRLGGLTAAVVGYGCATDRTGVRRLWLADRGSGALRSSPVGFLDEGGGGQLYDVTALGTALAEVHTGGGVHVDAYSDYYRLTDGRRIRAPRPSAHRVVSLDAASGTVRLCAPLAVGTYRETVYDELDDDPYTYNANDLAAYRPPWLATVHRGRLLLKRCGSATVRDLGPATQDTALQLTARYVAWSRGSHRAVHVRRLGERTTLTFNGVSGALAGTDHRLWVGDAATKAYVIEP
jgi:hypothetical protein